MWNENDDNITFDVDPVDQALADLALMAVSTLKQQMVAAKQPKDKIAAANSILDRLGYGRTTRAQADQADREIRSALEAVAKTAEQEGLLPAGAEPIKPAIQSPPLRIVDDLEQDND